MVANFRDEIIKEQSYVSFLFPKFTSQKFLVLKKIK
jgi:hypothetical protein